MFIIYSCFGILSTFIILILAFFLYSFYIWLLFLACTLVARRYQFSLTLSYLHSQALSVLLFFWAKFPLAIQHFCSLAVGKLYPTDKLCSVARRTSGPSFGVCRDGSRTLLYHTIHRPASTVSQVAFSRVRPSGSALPDPRSGLDSPVSGGDFLS